MTLMSMKQEVYILPVRCERCSAIFDLWYDLQGEDQDVMFLEGEKMKRLLSDSYCWKCRREVMDNLDDGGDDDGDDGDFIVEENSDLVLDYE